jgi:hypothetical protein
MNNWIIVGVVLFVLGCLCCISWIISRIYSNYIRRQVEVHKNTLSILINTIGQNPTLSPLFHVPIYYINLQRSPERRTVFEQQANMWHLNFTRVNAIDGKKLFGNTMDGVTYSTDYKGMTNTEIACCMSHLRAIYLAHKNNDKYALIMEDDTSFGFVPFWAPNAIESLIKKAPPDTGIIQLAWFAGSGSCGYQNNYKTQVQNKGKFCLSCSAYIITEKGMNDVLSIASVSDTHIHIKKPLDPNLKSNGVADEYIYCSTNVVTTGLPLFMPDNSSTIMDTTIVGRMGNHVGYQLQHYHDVLRIYATAPEMPISF